MLKKKVKQTKPGRSPGRPPKAPGEKRDADLRVRLLTEERQKIEAAAEASGVGLSAWIRQRLLAGL